MSNNEIWRENGSVIPFPRPTAEIGFAIDEPPLVSLCFSEAWLPHIIGALKILMRPETYETDGDTAQLDAQEAMKIPTLLCTPPEIDTNWYLKLTITTGLGEIYMLNYTGPDNSRQWFAELDEDQVFGIDQTISGYNRDDPDLQVGGKVDWVVEGFPQGSVRAITLFITRCDGGVDTVSDFTPYAVNNDEWQSLRIVCGNTVTVRATTYDQWLCGPA